MTDTPLLKDRLAVVEDHVVGVHRAKRLAGFASYYAALSVAAIVLPWFPAYGPVDRGDDVYVHEPLILAPSGYGFLTFVMLAILLSLLATAVFARRLRNVAVPLAAAGFAALGAILLSNRFGALGDPSLTGPGCAMITVLVAIVVLGAAHAVVLRDVARGDAADAS